MSDGCVLICTLYYAKVKSQGFLIPMTAELLLEVRTCMRSDGDVSQVYCIICCVGTSEFSDVSGYPAQYVAGVYWTFCM